MTSQAPKGTLAGPLGPLSQAPTPSGGMAQGASYFPVSPLPWPQEPAVSERPNRTPTKGISDNGSIATFTPDKKSQFLRIFFSARVDKLFPRNEVGTGKLKFHVKPDGSRITYCGTIRPDENGNVAACENKPWDHKIIALPNSCKRRACPECYPHWSTHAADRVTASLNSYILMKVPQAVKDELKSHFKELNMLDGGEWLDKPREIEEFNEFLDSIDEYLPRHIVFSPDARTISKMVTAAEKDVVRTWGPLDEHSWRYANEFHRSFWRRYHRKLRQIARSAGLFAYIEVDHDMRLRSNKESDKADRRCDSNRYREVLDRKDWRYNTRFSPHSHLIGFGALEDSKAFYKRTKWIYRNFGTVTSAAGLMNYLLSHAPDIDGMHSVRRGGELSPLKLSVEGEIRIPVFPKCQECLEEGIEKNKAGRVIAKLDQVEYQDIDGHKELMAWTFKDGGLSSKPYRTTQIFRVFRHRPKKRPPGRLPPWLVDKDVPGWTGPYVWNLRYLKEPEEVKPGILPGPEWVSWKDWKSMDENKRAAVKWRRWFSLEEYQAASLDVKLQTFAWV